MELKLWQTKTNADTRRAPARPARTAFAATIVKRPSIRTSSGYDATAATEAVPGVGSQAASLQSVREDADYDPCYSSHVK